MCRYPARIEIDPVQNILIAAASIADGAGFVSSPGEMLLGPRRAGGRTILAVGSSLDVRAVASSLGAMPIVVDRRNCVLVPGFVNAHTHLDLSLIGPVDADPDDGFMGFVDLVRTLRPVDPDRIREAVEVGIQLSQAGGVVAVGDIAGAAMGVPRIEPYETLEQSSLAGVSFIEFFAIGRGEASGLSKLDACVATLAARSGTKGPVRIGLSPHATNTVSIAAYQHAIELSIAHGWPIMTHVAETIEERMFIGNAEGPQREFLERIGLWDDSLLTSIGLGRSPVAHLAPVFHHALITLVHVNDADSDDISRIANARASVVYCPRASAYFGASRRLGHHRYAEMIDAGIRVALGTDSIINLNRSDRITPFDDAAMLVKRDGLDPTLALAMCTTRSAEVLGLDPSGFTFACGSVLMGCNAIETENPTEWSSIFQQDRGIELLR